MEFNAKHTSIILKRVFDCQDPAEQIELICGEDKRRIPIHRVILNAASKYFKDLMGPNSQDDRPKEFLLDYADGETIKTVVNFCYSGNIDLTEENVEKYLMVANRAEIDLLEEKCRQFYAAKLSADNSVSILAVADTYRFVDLGDQAFELICGELETIPSEDIQNLSYQLVRELLKSDKTRDSGDVCAMRLVEWYQCNEDDRAVHMPELLKLVRLEQLTAEFLDDTLEAVYKKFKCSDILNAEYKRRALSQRVNVCVPRSRSIVYVVLQYCYGDKLSSIKIENLNNGLSIFEEAAEIPMGQCSCFGAIVYRNKIYILGGCANGSYLKSVSSYDLNSRDEGVLSEMQVARQMFSTIVLGKYIYVIGGYGVGGDLNACERFDTETNKWEPVKSINAARHCAAVTVLNGYIYAAGGFADGWPSTSVELYDPNIDEWTKIAPMNKARYTFGLVESNGFLYAIGGAAKAIEKFDPYKNVWTEIGSFDGCDEITNAINVDGKLFTMKLTGEYGRIDIDECGRCAFVSIAKSEYNPILKYTGVHFLCHT